MMKNKKWINSLGLFGIAFAVTVAVGVLAPAARAAFEAKQLCCQVGEGDEVNCVSRSVEEGCPRGLIPMCTLEVE